MYTLQIYVVHTLNRMRYCMCAIPALCVIFSPAIFFCMSATAHILYVLLPPYRVMFAATGFCVFYNFFSVPHIMSTMPSR